MKILLLGSAGFIGSNLARKLTNHKLICVDDMSSPPSMNNSYYNRQYRFYLGDINNKDFLSKLFSIEKPDVVINTLYSDKFDYCSAVYNLCNLVDLYKIKLIQISSYDTFLESGYKKTSLLTIEKLIQNCSAGTILYTSNLYGPRQYNSFMVYLIKNLLKNEEVVLWNDGLHTREWTYINDVSKALEQVVELDKPAPSYILKTGHIMSALELHHLLAKKIAPANEPKFSPKPILKEKQFSTLALNNLPDWSPTSFQTNLESTWRWYSDNKWFLDL